MSSAVNIGYDQAVRDTIERDRAMHRGIDASFRSLPDLVFTHKLNGFEHVDFSLVTRVALGVDCD